MTTNLKLNRRGYNNLINDNRSDEEAEKKSVIYVTNGDGEQSILHINEVYQDDLSIDIEYEAEGMAQFNTARLNELVEFDCFNLRATYIGLNDVELCLIADLSVQFKRGDIKRVKV